jgi:hypothetical protein
VDFIRRRILDLDYHVHLLSARIYERIAQVDYFWHFLRAGADTEAALFTNVVEAGFPEMQPPHRDTIHPSAWNRFSRKLGCMRIQQLAYATGGAQTGAQRRPL